MLSIAGGHLSSGRSDGQKQRASRMHELCMRLTRIRSFIQLSNHESLHVTQRVMRSFALLTVFPDAD